MRIKDSKIVAEEVFRWKGPLEDFDPDEWVEDTANIGLTDGDRNLALFQYDHPGVYIGHYFFNARGKQALEVGRRLLAEIFSYPQVEVVKGYTPLTNLGARWMSRQLGFKSYGPLVTDESCELFILTKKEYMNG